MVEDLGRLGSPSHLSVTASSPSQDAAPAAVISLLMLSFTFLGDGLRDALDPRTRAVE